MNSGCVSPGAIVHGWHGQGLIGWQGIPTTAPHHGHATIRPTRLWATIRATRGPALIPPARGRATTPAARGEAFSSPPWHRGTADGGSCRDVVARGGPAGVMLLLLDAAAAARPARRGCLRLQRRRLRDLRRRRAHARRGEPAKLACRARGANRDALLLHRHRHHDEPPLSLIFGGGPASSSAAAGGSPERGASTSKRAGTAHPRAIMPAATWSGTS